MADRQDIDALLVGALYGELSSADHQRLEAHLASHPQDRAALDAMTHTRGHLREGLAAVPDAEPPAALSALLLQEAARRAPSRKSAEPGVWAWLQNAMRSMATHPALAAAAAFVLIAGVAGSFVLSGRSPMHEASAPTEMVAIAPEAPAAAAPEPAPEPAAATAEQYQAGLIEEPKPGDVAVAATVPADRKAPWGRDSAASAKNAPPARDSADDALALSFRDGVGPEEKKKLEAALADPDLESATKGAKADKVARAERRYVPVTTPDPTIKEDEAEGAARGRADSYARQAESVAAPSATKPSAAPPPTAPVEAPAAAPSTGAASAGAVPYDPAREQERDEWARAMHQKVLSFVKRRDCASAATFAAEIAVRASDYYVKRFSGDRAVLPCKAAIDRARKKEADRRSRAPTKDGVSDQPAATPATR